MSQDADYVKVLEDKVKTLELQNAEKDAEIKRLSAKLGDSTPAATAAAAPAAPALSDSEKAEFIVYDDDVALGKTCPSLEGLEFHNGDAVNVGAGKVVVVTFFSKLNKSDFSTLSYLTDVQEKYGDKIQVLGISRDGESRDVSRWVEKFQDQFFAELSGPGGKAGVLVKAHFPLAFDENDTVNKEFKKVCGKAVIGVGFTVIIDGEGTIRWYEKFVRGESPMGQFDQQLENIVEGKPLLSNGNAPEVEEQEEEMTGDMDDIDPFGKGDGY